MFLFIDESEEYNKKVVGGILLPLSKVSLLEKNITEVRIQEKLFGEIKWNRICKKYFNAYLAVLDQFWSEGEATYHSCSYTNPKSRYSAAYMLIKAVSWKIQRRYGKDPLYVLFDNGGAFGTRSYPIIKDYLKRDPEFVMPLEFCNHGASNILASLQVSDLLTGAVASRINAINLGDVSKNFVIEIEKKNRASIGIPILRFPRLDQYKMHHFDLTRLDLTKLK